MKTFLRFAVTLAAGAVLAAGSALANTITVNNFSFEQIFGSSLPNTGCGPGCAFSIGAIPSWTVSAGTLGQFQPGPSPSAYFNSLTDGNTVAFANSGTISQTVGPLVQAGVVYTLLVDLGNRADAGENFTAGASLLVNGIAYAATGIAPTDGNWSTFMATYTGTSSDAGLPITVQLTTTGAQADFDNVRLSDSTVPEPGVTEMLGAGLVTLALFVRRKKITSARP